MVEETELERQRREFGLWIRSLRVLAGYEQDQAADRAGLSRVQWSRIETGATGTKRETLDRIARAIHADPSEAYRRAGYQPPQQSESSGQGKRTTHVIASYRGQLTPEIDEHLARIVEAYIQALPPSPPSEGDKE